jgi:hypothetical protein
VDAHLHPQVGVGALQSQPWTHRLPGLLALAGGLTYSACVLFLAVSGETDRDVGGLFWLAALLMFFSLPGDYMTAHGRRIAASLGVIGGFVVIANLVPWDAAWVLVMAAFFITFGGMLTLAAIRAGIGAVGRWFLLTVTMLLPLVVSIPVAMGLVSLSVDPGQAVVVILAYGVAWILIGLRMSVQGSPTIVDLPPTPTEMEVPAA